MVAFLLVINLVTEIPMAFSVTNGMDILEKLFNNPHRLKLLRLFLFNPGVAFDRKEIKLRSKISSDKVSRELSLFKKIKLIKNRRIRSKVDFGKVGTKGFELNSSFPLTNSLRNLLNQDFLQKKAGITRRFKNCGRIKLLIVSGVFLDDPDGRIDLFIVGDQLKRKVIDNIVRLIEADIGRELTYAILETEDFIYRLNSSDKFIRDVFDYSHEKIVNKMGL